MMIYQGMTFHNFIVQQWLEKKT